MTRQFSETLETLVYLGTAIAAVFFAHAIGLIDRIPQIAQIVRSALGM